MATLLYARSGFARSGATRSNYLENVVGEDPISYIIQVLIGDVWEQLNDVVAENGIRFRRGIQGNGPGDLVATPGTLEFTLRNDEFNSEEILSWYSPDHPDVRAGWTQGIPIRLHASLDGVIIPLWRGKIRTILPIAGIYGERLVYVTGQGPFGDLVDKRIRTLDIQIGQTEDVLLQTIIDALPVDAQPPAVDFDAGLDEVTYAFDQVGAGANGLGLVTDIGRSVQGRIFEAADGTMRYLNRHNAALQSKDGPVVTVADTQILDASPGLLVPDSLDNVFNRVRGTIHPKTAGDDAETVIYRATAIVSVAPGQVATVWGTYADPDNVLKLIGATDVQDLEDDVDYMGNSAKDGSGDDITDDLVITSTPFASTIRIDIENDHPTATAYLVGLDGKPFLQVRGRSIADDGPMTLESFSEETYGDRRADLDLPFQDDPAKAQDLVDFIRTNYRSLARQLDRLPLGPNYGEELLEDCLRAEIGDIWAVSEEVTGLDVNVIIQGIEGTITDRNVLTVVLAMAPGQVSDLWVWDESHMDEDTVWGWA